MVPASRVKAWAIARSIYRTACLLGYRGKKDSIEADDLKSKTISFGSAPSIIFTDQELIKLYRKKIAIPKLVPFSKTSQIFVEIVET